VHARAFLTCVLNDGSGMIAQRVINAKLLQWFLPTLVQLPYTALSGIKERFL